MDINLKVGKRDVEGLIARGIPPKDAMRLAKKGIRKGVNPAHKVKKRPFVKYEDRDSGEFFY